jgi:hypothetical protein
MLFTGLEGEFLIAGLPGTLISVDGPAVHQPNIPGLPGNKGFAAQERAQTAAEFVVKKIRNSEMPPTVTIEDLNNMGVLKQR